MSGPRFGEIELFAPCKINPTLVVIERRADGFHELDLTYLALELADRVKIAPRGAGPALRVGGAMATADVPRDATNLALRALRAVESIAARRGAAAAALGLDLEKHVPSQAGLGGGSSDAAAAALGASTLLGIDPADGEVAAMLAALGSDCSFFHAARAVGHGRGRGRGERIEVLPACTLRLHVAVLTPDVPASTAKVYAAVVLAAEAGPQRARGEGASAAWLRAADLAAARSALCNDLEPAALRAYPELRRWRDLLDRRRLEHFRLAGSGSSFFGLYSEAEAARSDLAEVTSTAREAGLGLRGSWVTRPASQGAGRSA